MPLLRNLPNGQIVTQPVGSPIDATLPGYDARNEQVLKKEAQGISQKMAAQSLASLMKQQTAMKSMAEQASRIGQAESVRQRNVMLIGQLQSLLSGLKLAIGWKPKTTAPLLIQYSDDYTE